MSYSPTVIKRIQQVEVSVPPGNLTGTQTISPVDLNKAALVVSGWVNASMVAVELSNSSTITAKIGATQGQTATAHCFVVEFV